MKIRILINTVVVLMAILFFLLTSTFAQQMKPPHKPTPVQVQDVPPPDVAPKAIKIDGFSLETAIEAFVAFHSFRTADNARLPIQQLKANFKVAAALALDSPTAASAANARVLGSLSTDFLKLETIVINRQLAGAATPLPSTCSNEIEKQLNTGTWLTLPGSCL